MLAWTRPKELFSAGFPMTEKQLLAIYKKACAAAGRREDPLASAAWQDVLQAFSKDEVTEALSAWWNDTEPTQGSLIPRGSTMPRPADLKARIMRARNEAYLRSADVQRRRREIEEFWIIADERGWTEQEIRERWPSYVGTRPKPKEQAA